MIDDWLDWHRHYDTPNSPLAQRLATTHIELRRALSQAPCDTDGVVRLVSICAGEGRDVLPVLADGGHGCHVKALLLEMDVAVAEGARRNVLSLGLSDVEVRVADAGTIDSFADVLPAHVVVASGVFGNISMADTRRTVAALKTVLAPGGLVVWTRSRRLDGSDRSLDVRAVFLEHNFAEVSFSTIPDGKFRIGVHKRATEVIDVPTLQIERRMFRFSSPADPPVS